MFICLTLLPKIHKLKKYLQKEKKFKKKKKKYRVFYMPHSATQKAEFEKIFAKFQYLSQGAHYLP